MGDFSVFHWLIVLAVILALSGGNRLVELARYLGGRGKGGPPTHPLPVTGPVETSRGSANTKDLQ
jgi:hypothetical protein